MGFGDLSAVLNGLFVVFVPLYSRKAAFPALQPAHQHLIIPLNLPLLSLPPGRIEASAGLGGRGGGGAQGNGEEMFEEELVAVVYGAGGLWVVGTEAVELLVGWVVGLRGEGGWTAVI